MGTSGDRLWWGPCVIPNRGRIEPHLWLYVILWVCALRAGVVFRASGGGGGGKPSYMYPVITKRGGGGEQQSESVTLQTDLCKLQQFP